MLQRLNSGDSIITGGVCGLTQILAWAVGPESSNRGGGLMGASRGRCLGAAGRQAVDRPQGQIGPSVGLAQWLAHRPPLGPVYTR